MARKTSLKKATPLGATTTKEITRKVPRSAKSGLFVTEEYARRHPSTTEIETVKFTPRPKKKP